MGDAHGMNEERGCLKAPDVQGAITARVPTARNMLLVLPGVNVAAVAFASGRVIVDVRPRRLRLVCLHCGYSSDWRADHLPDVRIIDNVRREHMEDSETWLHARLGRLGRKASAATTAHRLGDLRSFLDRTTEWGWTDAPGRALILLGYSPRHDRPLPRFVDDGAAAKLPPVARAHHDPFARRAVETLARTDLRTGELLALTIDAVVQIDAHHWLCVPVDKLRTDRYIPLHPAFTTLLDDGITTRLGTLRTNRPFTSTLSNESKPSPSGPGSSQTTPRAPACTGCAPRPNSARSATDGVSAPANSTSAMAPYET